MAVLKEYINSAAYYRTKKSSASHRSSRSICNSGRFPPKLCIRHGRNETNYESMLWKSLRRYECIPEGRLYFDKWIHLPTIGNMGIYTLLHDLNLLQLVLGTSNDSCSYKRHLEHMITIELFGSQGKGDRIGIVSFLVKILQKAPVIIGNYWDWNNHQRSETKTQ